jgi:hypothetical protein
MADPLRQQDDPDMVYCVDSHVLLRAGALAHLLAWFSAHPGSRDLLHGPTTTRPTSTTPAPTTTQPSVTPPPPPP